MFQREGVSELFLYISVLFVTILEMRLKPSGISMDFQGSIQRFKPGRSQPFGVEVLLTQSQSLVQQRWKHAAPWRTEVYYNSLIVSRTFVHT